MLSISACGGGGGSSGESGLSDDVQTPDAQVPDAQVPDVQVPDAQVPDAQVPDAQVPDVQVPDVQIPVIEDSEEGATTAFKTSELQSGASARVLTAGGTPAVGIVDGTLIFPDELVLDVGGGLAFKSKVSTPLVRDSFAEEYVFSGSILNPEVVLGKDSVIENIREGHLYSGTEQMDVASNGSLGIVARVSTPRSIGSTLVGTQASTTTAIHIVDGTARSLMSVGDDIRSLNGEGRLISIERVSVSDSGIAVLAKFGGRGTSEGILVRDAQGFKVLVAGTNGSVEGAPQVDGCRVLLGNTSMQRMEMLNSGQLLFNATIDGGNVTSACKTSQSAIMAYDNEKLRVLARTGNAVPGSSTIFFGGVLMGDVLSDGSFIVYSRLFDQSRGTSRDEVVYRDSAWLFKSDVQPRLLYVEGETLRRSGDEHELALENIDVDNFSPDTLRLAVNASGHMALSLFTRSFSTRSEKLTLHSGAIRSDIPFTSLAAPGASSLMLLDEVYEVGNTDSSPITSIAGAPEIAEGFQENDRFSRFGDFAINSQGDMYFHARVIDSTTSRQKGDYIFRRSALGELSVVVSPLDRVALKGRDELILSSVLNSGFGITFDKSNLDLVVMNDDSLILKADATTIRITFP